MPRVTAFVPQEAGRAHPVTMTVDEYEAVRLIDLEGLTQEQAAAQMEIARTTAQAIYLSARKKLADCLVNGRRLVIAGGDVAVCTEGCCSGRLNCPKRKGRTSE